MKKLLLLLFAISLFSVKSYSQDFIYTRNNNRIAAKIVSLEINEIHYKDYNNLDGEVIAIKNKDVSLVAFEDGHLEFFEPVKKIIMRNDFNRNLITYHLADLIVNNFVISYERINKSGKVGFEIPISFGYSHYANFEDMYNQFYTGLSINFYPTGQGKWRFITGPAMRIGVGRWDYYDYNYEGDYVNYDEKTGYFKLLVNNGVIFTPIKSLSFSVIGYIGIRYAFSVPPNYKKEIMTTGGVSVNLAYRF